MMKNIHHFHSILKKELDLTQKYITTFSYSKDRSANIAIKHIVDNKGKMLRPILLILSGRFSFHLENTDTKNEKPFIEDIAKASAILELIQMSSLIHDDVLDQSSERRNKSTLNKLRGNRFAILMGDYLVAQSLKNCYSLVHNAQRLFDPVVLYSFLDGISKLVLGEIQQNNFNENMTEKNNGIESYFEIIENKTASLFSLACFVGSTIGSNNTDYSAALKSYGHNIGMAYQIIDDLRDFSLTNEISGEKNFQDIKFGIKTLPIIYANHFSHNGESERLNNAFNSKNELSNYDKLEIIDILQKTGSIEKSLAEVHSHINEAKNIINKLPHNEYSILLLEFADYLSDICETVVDDIMCIKFN